MTQQEKHTLELSAGGSSALTVIQTLLQIVDLNGDVTKVSIEVESTSGFDIPERNLQSLIGVDTDEAETPEEPDPEPEPENDLPSGLQLEDVVRFNEDSDAYTVAQVLGDRRDEGFLELGQIQQFTPNEHGISHKRFSGILWDLCNRGLVEKKDHPRDGRKKVYKLTDKGEASLEVMENGVAVEA